MSAYNVVGKMEGDGYHRTFEGWIYSGPKRKRVIDCDALKMKKNLNEIERSILAICNVTEDKNENEIFNERYYTP